MNALTILLAAALGATYAAGAFMSLDEVITPPAKAQARFQGVTNIVFTDATGLDTNEWQRFSVKDREAAQRLLSMIKLKPKAPCQCLHRYGALFEGPSGAVHVSFCEHCFDLGDDRFGFLHNAKALLRGVSDHGTET